MVLQPGAGRWPVVEALPPYVSNGVIGSVIRGCRICPGRRWSTGSRVAIPTTASRGSPARHSRIATDVQLDGVWASAAPEWVRLHGAAIRLRDGRAPPRWAVPRRGRDRHGRDARCSAHGPCPPSRRCEITVRVDRAGRHRRSLRGIDPTDVPGRGRRHAQPQDQGPNEGVDGRLLLARAGRHLARWGWPTRRRSAATRRGARRPPRAMSAAGSRPTYRVRARADRRYGVELTDRDRCRACRTPSPTSRPAGWRRSAPSAGSSGCGRRTGRPGTTCGRAGSDRRSRRAVAGDHGCERLLPAELRPRLVTGEHVAVRAGVLAELPLLPRPRDVGHRDVHGAAAALARRRMRPTRCSTTGIRHLEPARQNAALHGWRGAMYPWESCPHARRGGRRPGPGHTPRTTSASTSPSPSPRYVHATGDLDYARARRMARAPRSVAEFVASRASSGPARGFEIRDTVGPREHYEPVDNNAYTNMAAAGRCRRRSACARVDRTRRAARSGARSRRAWSCRGTRRRGAIINHDGARLDEPQGGVPEGAAGLFPVGYGRRRRSSCATYRYAAAEQAPRLRRRADAERAAAGLRRARRRARACRANSWSEATVTFINEPFLEPDEYPRTRTDRPRASPMFANLSGYPDRPAVWLHRDTDRGRWIRETWCSRPVTLPEGWRGIEIERVWVRGRPWRLEARGGDPAATLEPA